MADYREISQEYARGGIKAVILLNGGAAVAVLSQIGGLPPHIATSAANSMMLWAIGTALGAIGWIMAFYSTRYVDKWQDEQDDRHRKTSNLFQVLGLICVGASVALFLIGSICLAAAFRP
jgi:hypothetical protein